MADGKFPDTIPPRYDGATRTIVLCFDGTQNKISDKFSNVAKFFGLLDRSDRAKQLVYYQTGIGTYTSSKLFIGPITSRLAMVRRTMGQGKVETLTHKSLGKTLDSMIATSIDDHVKEGYRYLMDNYVEGDRICIFGFSRGAHTARVLAGMIHKVGLLPVGNYRHIKYAWEVYCLNTETAWKKAFEFKKSFCMDVKIEFVGIWDSVGSVGFRGTGCSFSLHNSSIKTFRHALALDERRARFQANTWRITPSTADERNKSTFKTDVEEVWFAGCHSDVGGGNCDTYEPHSLSRISLRWMIRQCFLSNSGIQFVTSELRRIGLDPMALYPAVAPRPPLTTSLSSTSSAAGLSSNTSSEAEKGLTEEEHDLRDLLCKTNDELSKKPGGLLWWVLEAMPMVKRKPREDGSWKKQLTMNLGRPRHIACQGYGIKVHRTVKMKKDDKSCKYVPRAHLSVEPEWVA